MLIIVEGCDGAGKSTFVEMLASMVDHPDIRHFGPPKQWAVSEYELSLQDYVPGSGQNIICDRFHIGELIYGPLYRGKSELSGAGLKHVEAWLRRLGAVICFLDPPLQALTRNLSSRGDDYIDLAHVGQIHRQYGEQFVRTPLPKQIVANYPNAHNAARLLSFASRTEIDADRTMSGLTSYVGWPYPQALFVGDTASSMAGEHRQAFVPWPGRSGEFLMDALIQTRIVTWGTLNSAEDDVPQAVKQLKPEAVITLGRKAFERCAQAGVDVRANLVHPAAAKRFAGCTPKDYGQMIEAFL